MGETMRNFLVFLAVMTVFAWACPTGAQDTGQAAETPQNEPVKEKPRYTAPPATILFESSVGDVHFPHKRHLKMRCNKCHHQIQAATLETPHEEYLESSWVRCLTCHTEDPDANGRYFKCGQCHHSELENIADETLSAKVVVHKSCWKCHKTSTGVGASKSCADCHTKNTSENSEEIAGD
jgi:hypothetical protein